MRIIAGKRRGLQLKVPEGSDVRPTADRVKEAVFSALQFELHDRRVLDLFAGSGALGLEAISRGASFCTFVERDSRALRALETNVKAAGFEDSVSIVEMDFREALKESVGPFDLVFLDPPYAAGFYDEALALLTERQLLSEDAIVIVESDRNHRDLTLPTALYLQKEKKYGSTTIKFLRRQTIEESSLPR